MITGQEAEPTIGVGDTVRVCDTKPTNPGYVGWSSEMHSMLGREFVVEEIENGMLGLSHSKCGCTFLFKPSWVTKVASKKVPLLSEQLKSVREEIDTRLRTFNDAVFELKKLAKDLTQIAEGLEEQV